jgi:hypothetical protein
MSTERENSVSFCMGGLFFRAESDSPHVWMPSLQGESLLGRSFRRFTVEAGGEPHVRLCIRRIDPVSLTLPPLSEKESAWLGQLLVGPEESPHSPLLRSPTVRALLQDGWQREEDLFVEVHSFSISVFNFTRAELHTFYIPAHEKVVRAQALFPLLFAPFLPAFDRAMVHAAGVVGKGPSALFLAPDGGGKTTVARHARDGRVLGDDHLILAREGDAFVAHGTPWALYADGPGQAELGGIFLLEQATRFGLTPLEPVHALEYLWNEHLAYWLPLPANLRVRLFQLLYDVCHQVPVYRMRFAKDFVDWGAVDAAMEG